MGKSSNIMLIWRKLRNIQEKRDNCDSLKRIESYLFFIIHDQEAVILIV